MGICSLILCTLALKRILSKQVSVIAPQLNTSDCQLNVVQATWNAGPGNCLVEIAALYISQMHIDI